MNNMTSYDLWNKWKQVPIEEKLKILNKEMSATPDAIIWGYKLILGRNPESVERVEGNHGEYSQSILRTNMLSCSEFTTYFENSIRKDPELVKIDNDIKKGSVKVEKPSELLIWQTSDREKYWPMLRETSRTIQEYCRRHPVNHESYIGIKKGVWPWQATHNRIYKLNELIESDYKGWFLYIDADAYIADFNFSFLTI